MVVVVEGRQLNLPHSLPSTTSITTSFLFDPISLSLALMHPDSSFSLYPSLTSSSTVTPPPPIIIPPPSSSATFLHLQTQDKSAPRVLFLVLSPNLTGASLLLHFYLLNPTTNSFSKARVISNQTDLNFDENKLGLVFQINHGIAIRLSGSTNVFAIYSISNSKVYVFAVKLVTEHEDGRILKVMKCAVIDCSLPVFSIRVSLGFLILGEENGVRVFPLRPLVKGRVNKHSRNGGSLRQINGVSSRGNQPDSGPILRSKSLFLTHLEVGKLKSIKLRQESKEGGACFVPFMSKEGDCKDVLLKTVKAISIQVLSPYKFLILDSVGDLHLLCLSNPVFGSETHCQMKRLSLSMKVQSFAVLPDLSSRAQTVWLSDGHYTLHAMVLSEVDSSEGETEGKDSTEIMIQNSVIQAIFTGEKIQEIVSFAANEILILGQVTFLLMQFPDGACLEVHLSNMHLMIYYVSVQSVLDDMCKRMSSWISLFVYACSLCSFVPGEVMSSSCLQLNLCITQRALSF